MNSIIKPILIILITLFCIHFLIFKAEELTNEEELKIFKYALKTASQDATSIIRDLNILNTTYDGSIKEDENILFDYSKAVDRFYRSMTINLNENMETDYDFSKALNIPLTGIVAYDFIIGQTKEGYTIPYSYTFNDSKNKVIYNFTLGDLVEIKKYNEKEFIKKNIDDINQIAKNMTNEEFRDYIIIETINKFLKKYSNEDNLITKDILYKGLNFNLAHADYTKDKEVYNLKNSLIDGAGFFAIVDTYKSTADKTHTFLRLFAFGGSELLLLEK
ncbi:hypothetical protein WG909_13920 [Peptostreptococcaceae bacterium AGR-M142]